MPRISARGGTAFELACRQRSVARLAYGGIGSMRVCGGRGMPWVGLGRVCEGLRGSARICEGMGRPWGRPWGRVREGRVAIMVSSEFS
jgi:hypothetical protein